MDSQERRNAICETIERSEKPISASALAKQFHVSRQIVVGDVALLRAAGKEIIATPRGYVMDLSDMPEGVEHIIAVMHDESQLPDEIYTIVDLGGALIDVIVEHPLYGQLCGKLHIFSRYDADQFFEHLKTFEAKPLSNLTNGLHLHTIRAHDEVVFARICDALESKGFLYKK